MVARELIVKAATWREEGTGTVRAASVSSCYGTLSATGLSTSSPIR